VAIPIIHDWEKYFDNPDEGLGSSYERIVLNRLIAEAVREYGVKSILESPSFGFTGLSGINLMQAALDGAEVHLEDHNELRIEEIKALWQKLDLPLEIKYNKDYSLLDYPDKSIDMSFSFSAIWFVKDLPRYLGELSRVSSKLIFISVPNRAGIGYKTQIKDYSPELYPEVNPGFIDPAVISWHLRKLGWRLEAKGYFDCPLWPDIGMSKEDFLMKHCMFCKLMGKCKVPVAQKAPGKRVSIMDFYAGKDPDFEDRMMRYSYLERFAPEAFKKYWAHHYYLQFVPESDV